MTPKKPRRWLQSAIAEAAKCNVAMPWQRGTVRSGTIARREEAASTNVLPPRALLRRA
ncbi:hypothetical protein [Phaeovulum sp.]|uniref:hypothetical protein n=1 Tax=Phaeovulum sp. TaxID=2934796 RepID=UPI003569C2CC